MTTNEIAEALQKHAVENYEVSGWDYIVECWTREEIAQELELVNVTTLEDAIHEFGEIARIWDGRRREVQAEIF